jgi:8-oxo-dGTP pyrophosphatase MutT (NUDIX family)
MSPLRERLLTGLQGREKGLLRDLPETATPPKPAAVLVPFFEKAGEDHLLFTRRTDTVRDHKGQISFPGGARDPADPSLARTALRETQEEIGIPPEAIELLGELDDYITVTNYLVRPFVGIIPHPYRYVPRAEEVAEVIEVPLRVLREPARHTSNVVEWKGVTREIHYFDVGSCIIWGVTARILLQVFDSLD